MTILGLISKIAVNDKVQPYKMPGIWERAIDKRWTIKVNAHMMENEGIPPFSVLVEHCGLPAGLFDSADGAFAAGTEVNEEAFYKALEKAAAV